MTNVRAESGFTTLEALVAMGIFAIVMLGIGSLPVSSIHANLRARNLTAATNLARDKIEELRHAGYTSLAAGADAGLLNERGEEGANAAHYSRSWTVSSGSIPGGKELTVKIAWTDTKSNEIKMTTIVADPG